jgi:hypothetical protein
MWTNLMPFYFSGAVGKPISGKLSFRKLRRSGAGVAKTLRVDFWPGAKRQRNAGNHA